jgi:hypothetical protein
VTATIPTATNGNSNQPSPQTDRERYRDRALLLALLTHHYPSRVEPDTSGEFSAVFAAVLVIELPTGPIRWHMHEADMVLIPHVPVSTTSTFDGHNRHERARRMALCVARGAVDPGDFEDMGVAALAAVEPAATAPGAVRVAWLRAMADALRDVNLDDVAEETDDQVVELLRGMVSRVGGA